MDCSRADLANLLQRKRQDVWIPGARSLGLGADIKGEERALALATIVDGLPIAVLSGADHLVLPRWNDRVHRPLFETMTGQRVAAELCALQPKELGAFFVLQVLEDTRSIASTKGPTALEVLTWQAWRINPAKTQAFLETCCATFPEFGAWRHFANIKPDHAPGLPHWSLSAYYLISELCGEVRTRPRALELYEDLKSIAGSYPGEPSIRWRQAKAATGLALNIIDNEYSRFKALELYNDVLYLAARYPEEKDFDRDLRATAVTLSTYRSGGDDFNKAFEIAQHYGKVRALVARKPADRQFQLELARTAAALAMVTATQPTLRECAVPYYEQLKALALAEATDEKIAEYQAEAAAGLTHYLVIRKATRADALQLYKDVRALPAVSGHSRKLSNMGLLLVPRLLPGDLLAAEEIQLDMEGLILGDPGVSDLALSTGVCLLGWRRVLCMGEPERTEALAARLDKLSPRWEPIVNRLLPQAADELKTSKGELRVQHLQALTGFLAGAMYAATRSGRRTIADSLVSVGDYGSEGHCGRAARLVYSLAWGDPIVARQEYDRLSGIEASSRDKVLELSNLLECPWHRISQLVPPASSTERSKNKVPDSPSAAELLLKSPSKVKSEQAITTPSEPFVLANEKLVVIGGMQPRDFSRAVALAEEVKDAARVNDDQGIWDLWVKSACQIASIAAEVNSKVAGDLLIEVLHKAESSDSAAIREEWAMAACEYCIAFSASNPDGVVRIVKNMYVLAILHQFAEPRLTQLHNRARTRIPSILSGRALLDDE